MTSAFEEAFTLAGVDPKAWTVPSDNGVARELVAAGFVVRLKIPKGAETKHYADSSISYLQWRLNAPGGCINVYLHGDAEAGQWVTAHMRIMRKRLPDNRVYLYIDLLVDKPKASATHRFAVFPKNTVRGRRDGVRIFSTPEPISGEIVVAPADAVFTQRVN